MRCLFCKQDSTNAKSVEHIIPQSLGNTILILPLGYICDKCNNYFARKVEKPFMDLPTVRLWRAAEFLPNKKNRFAQVDCFVNDQKTPIAFNFENDSPVFIMQSPKVFDELATGKSKEICVPIFTQSTEIEKSSLTSRFLAKIALEAFANDLKDIPNSLEELINDSQFDLIRNHARYGNPSEWPCSVRRVYSSEDKNKSIGDKTMQLVHESDFLIIKKTEKKDTAYISLYFVMINCGFEFTINLAGPEIESYYSWLSKHNNVSPLYLPKNKW